jgi:hypothetical protein
VNGPADELPMPPSLAARPRDGRGLPIPPVSILDDGTIDFTNINTLTGLELASQRRCSLCGEPVGRLVGFLGGPKAADVGAYADPPGHEACLRAACLLCPHLRYRRHTRRTDPPGQPTAEIPPLFSGDKPEAYVLVTARGYRIVPHPANHAPLYVPDAYVSVTRFDYGPDGILVVPQRKGGR